MAISPLNPFTSSSSPFPIYFLPQSRFSNTNFPSLRFNFTCCSSSTSNHSTIHQIDTQQIKTPVNPNSNHNHGKARRKPRPSFYEQVQDKWSVKTVSPRKLLPWQVREENVDEVRGGVRGGGDKVDAVVAVEPEKEARSREVSLGKTVNRPISAPWDRIKDTVKQPHIEPVAKVSKYIIEEVENDTRFVRRREKNGGRGAVESAKGSVKLGKLVSNNEERNVEIGNVATGGFNKDYDSIVDRGRDKIVGRGVVERTKSSVKLDEFVSKNEEGDIGVDQTLIGGFRMNNDVWVANGINGAAMNNEKQFGNVASGGVDESDSSVRLPWKREKDEKGVDRWTRNKTELAKKLIPEHELKRLQNVALRMMERIKVGGGGVTQALLDSIRVKWEQEEVVKLKFEGLSTLNMKRIHEVLEKRTGGLVIWRSGSSIVLFRGMTYKLQCAQSFTKQSKDHINRSQTSQDIAMDVDPTKEIAFLETGETSISSSAGYLKDLSKEELVDFNELNQMLDNLGPRFEDWAGRAPVPVDADLLLPVVPGYKRPFRILPHGAKHCLKNKQMTKYRRLARIMPPHFALGRNKELEGLARAIVKLWERSAIVKIAIKRGVLNTLNERMAEEIKRLTGGTLLSRNKDYIVFYRGNDFMPPEVTKTLKEREKETELCRDDEDIARQNALSFIDTNVKVRKGPLVAGTLSETMAAISRWKSHQSGVNVEKMISDTAKAKHAALVRYLGKKLHMAKLKAKKAERALSKVQEYLEPTELPTDLETLSDEERFLFRKMGLSMKPFLLLGIRGVFAGTVENMHLHWKFREVVKIIVKGQSFPQVKHIAISLEAESGGVLVSIDKTTKGYAVIVYRGKNYERPRAIKPKNLLSRRRALARSIELQRREALKHHIMGLEEQIELLKSDLEEMNSVKETDKITLKSSIDADTLSFDDDTDTEEDEGEEAYLETYESPDDGSSSDEEEEVSKVNEVSNN